MTGVVLDHGQELVVPAERHHTVAEGAPIEEVTQDPARESPGLARTERGGVDEGAEPERGDRREAIRERPAVVHGRAVGAEEVPVLVDESGSPGGGRHAAWLLAALLVASAVLNAVLFGVALRSYRIATQVRLDPTGEFSRSDGSRPPPPAPGEKRIVYLGDSRIEAWQELPQVPGAQSVNRGRGGQTTAMAQLRLQEDVLALDPDVVVLQIGINDLKAIGILPDRAAEIVEQAGRHVANIVERLRRRNVEVLVLTVFPIGDVDLLRRPFWSPAIAEAVKELNERIRGLAGTGVTVVDCDGVLGEAGRIRESFERDWLHVNRAGYAALDRTLTPVLRRIVADRK